MVQSNKRQGEKQKVDATGKPYEEVKSDKNVKPDAKELNTKSNKIIFVKLLEESRNKDNKVLSL